MVFCFRDYPMEGGLRTVLWQRDDHTGYDCLDAAPPGLGGRSAGVANVNGDALVGTRFGRIDQSDSERVGWRFW